MRLVPIIEGHSLSVIYEFIIILFYLQIIPIFYFTSALSAIQQEVMSVTVSTTRQSNAYSIMVTVIILLFLLSV